MHNVLEGVTRWLTRAWFESKKHVKCFYLGRRVREIDVQLLRQHPPNEFSQPPRSIQKHFKYWKASELSYWLLYYSLPLFMEFLPSLYWHHYALLVCAMHILLGDSISANQIDAAELMLMDFYKLLPELYGESSCTANGHLLSHLTKYVRLWGPLWTHSAFGYESRMYTTTLSKSSVTTRVRRDIELLESMWLFIQTRKWTRKLLEISPT